MCTLILTGCGGPVQVDPPTAAPAACTAAVAALPTSMEGLGGRDTSPSAPDVRAWGDPPVVLRCGVGRPADYDPTAECTQVNGVGWYRQAATGGAIYTATWAAPRIELSLPARYPPADFLVDVSNAITGHVAHPACPN